MTGLEDNIVAFKEALEILYGHVSSRPTSVQNELMKRTLCVYRFALEVLKQVSEAAVLDKRAISLLSPERDPGAN